MNQGNKRNKKDNKQKWKTNTRCYQPKNQSNNQYNHHSNNNNNNSQNNYHQQYNNYDNHYHNQNNYHANSNRNNRFPSNNSNSYHGRNGNNHRHKSYNQNHKFSNSRSAICRAPIEECNNQFMKEVNEQNKSDTVGIQQYRYRTWPSLGWQESESITVGKYFYSKHGTSYQTWKKPKELINNNNYEECLKDYPWRNQVHFQSKLSKQNISIKPFKVTTNTFPIQLNKHINVLQYEINIQPKADNERSNFNQRKYDYDITLDKLFKKFDKKKIVKSSFDPYVIEENSNTLFTFAVDKNTENYAKCIEFPANFDDENMYSFKLCSIHSLHFYAGMENENDSKNNDDEEDLVSPERRTQIFQCILSSILLKTGFKLINFGPSKGWYPTNQIHLNNVHPVYGNNSQIGVIRGFKASIDRSTNGVSLKVSNTNKILHVQTLADELADLYYSDPDRYGQNIGRFCGRKALYLPTQRVIDIKEIQMNENENSTFGKTENGKQIQISHKNNLLTKKIVNKVLPEKYGLVSNQHNFSFLPQFMYLLFDQELSKKQCKDTLQYLSKNIDHELKSVNNFVSHIINVQNNNNNNMILSLISISNKAYETNAYPLPNLTISIKLNSQNFKNYNELSIGSEWKNIGDLIIKPQNGAAKTLLVCDNKSMIKKARTHIINYLQRRKFGNLIINNITDFIPNDIFDINEIKQQLMNGQNEYDLLIFMLPNISDGSKLKRKIHRMCLQIGIKSQCMSDDVFYESSHSKQRNVSWGMMSDVVYKLGGTAYKILPNILGNGNNSNIININNTLIMGLDICHPTRIKSINRPSIAVMTSLYGNIMTPNICQQENALFFNNNRQEICGYKSMIKMCCQIFSKQLLRNDITKLPKIILFCRDGVSNSQIPQMVSKELTALLLSIRKIKKIEKIKIKFNDIKNWKPKIEWIVIQKRILDRFSPNRLMKLETFSPAFIVPSDIVSGEYFEFYLQIGKRSPKRILFIKDDLNLRKNGCVEIAQLLYAFHWLYPPCIPFQMGPLNVPVTIKLSDHYASMWQDMLNYNDMKINDIKINNKFGHNPQLVTID